MLMNSNKAQTENEAEDDKTEESENSGKAVTNMLKQVTISRKSHMHQYGFVTMNIANSKT